MIAERTGRQYSGVASQIQEKQSACKNMEAKQSGILLSNFTHVTYHNNENCKII